jgi:DNA polymerase-3 subunit alpha/error-prone DNA polymerase
MALTDINTVTGIYDFISNVKLGIKPLVGIDFRYNNEFRYIGLANASGLAEMNRF